MKNRLLVLWVACLTMYVCITTNDIYMVLKNVETGQYWTMKYMEKSTSILSKLRKSQLLTDDNLKNQSKGKAD
ncbi:MAG: hypothetical protein K2X81_23470 [Candidatus Obscuribacterales bacterium]|nr:hypothetical protein [Candidatus Obscuribacterales bacterium]